MLSGMSARNVESVGVCADTDVALVRAMARKSVFSSVFMGIVRN
jgi:hypothetical protein